VHKVVIDTNIFISALLSKSYPHKIINELILDKKVKSFTSADILKEFRTILSYLITGNIKHFPFGKFQNTEIISPANYYKKHWNL